MKESTRVLVALGAGLAGGAIIAATGNETLVRAADALAPIGTLWVNAIRMTIIPLVIALLIGGIAGGTDLRSVGRLGRRTIAVFVALLIGTAAVIMPIAKPVFSLLDATATRPPLPAGAAEAAAQVAASEQATGFAAWLVSLIPPNPIAAAASGAMLPLIIFGILFALAIARSPAASKDTLLGFFRALGEAMLVLIRWVVAAAPIGIFCLLLPLGARAGIGLAGAVGFYIVVYSLACILITLLLYPVVAIFGKVPIRRFARAALPPQLIALSSSSSIASLPALVEAADDALGLPKRVSGFVLPLAVSTFKLVSPVSWTVGALFVGWFYGIDLGLPQLALISVAAVFLSFAAPGVPRGAFLLLTPLFLAIGLPAEGIGILIAVDALPDMFATVVNATADLAAAAIVARSESDQAPADLGSTGI